MSRNHSLPAVSREQRLLWGCVRHSSLWLIIALMVGRFSFVQGQDSLNVTCTARLHYWEQAYGFAVAGDYLCVAAGYAGLVIVDVSDPTQPVELSLLDTPGIVTAITVSGNLAYVADLQGELRIIDIGNPSAPVEVGYCDFQGWVAYNNDIFIAGTIAYIAAENHGLRLVDISDPTHPMETGFCDTPGSAHGVWVSAGAFAYVADGQAGLRVVNVSDPANPYEVGSLDTPGSAQDVTSIGDYVYVADSTGGVRVISVVDPTAPLQVATRHLSNGPALNIEIAGSFAIVGCADGGVTMIDINFNPPEIVSTYPCESWVMRFDADRHRVYARDVYGVEIQIVDVTDGNAPFGLGEVNSTGGAYRVELKGNTAFLNSGQSVRAIGLTDPFSPIEIGLSPAMSIFAVGMTVFDDFLYLQDGSQFRIFDTSDPSELVELGSCELYGCSVDGFIVTDDMVMAECGSQGLLKLISVTDPTAPAIVGTYHTPDDISDFAVYGNYVYASCYDYGLWILDITDPDSIEEWWFSYPLGRIYSVAADDSKLCVAYWNPGEPDGFGVADITNPLSPLLLSSLELSAGNITLAGHYAYLAGYDSGFRIISLVDPVVPVEVGFYETPGYALDVAVIGNYAYVADSWNFGVYDCSAALSAPGDQVVLPQSLSLAVYPNPFNSEAKIRFELAKRERVRMAVFDLLGREVKTIVDDIREAGQHEVSFAMPEAASGLYFVRMQTMTRVKTEKVILLK